MRSAAILWRRLVAAALCGACVLIAAGQERPATKQNARASETPAAPPSAANDPAGSVAYSYEFTQPDFVVRHIVIEHDGAGRGRISFERRNDTEPLVDPMELSPAALSRIIAHWNALQFLETESSYQASKQFPHLGTMRLKMRQGTRERTAEFNWTDNRDASALVNEYRRVADQALFVFDIKLAREIQPLEAPKIMDRLNLLLSRNGLSDPQQLLPLLEELATDERLPLMARNHADRLLKKIKKGKG